MNGQGLKRVLGVTGDRLRVSDNPTASATNPGNTEELALYVNGGGIILALTPEQAAQRLSLTSGEPATGQPSHTGRTGQPKPAPQAPSDSPLGNYQQS
jgi:hypothetical protein